jgi:hypothetical protein
MRMTPIVKIWMGRTWMDRTGMVRIEIGNGW